MTRLTIDVAYNGFNFNLDGKCYSPQEIKQKFIPTKYDLIYLRDQFHNKKHVFQSNYMAYFENNFEKFIKLFSEYSINHIAKYDLFDLISDSAKSQLIEKLTKRCRSNTIITIGNIINYGLPENYMSLSPSRWELIQNECFTYTAGQDQPTEISRIRNDLIKNEI